MEFGVTAPKQVKSIYMHNQTLFRTKFIRTEHLPGTAKPKVIPPIEKDDPLIEKGKTKYNLQNDVERILSVPDVIYVIVICITVFLSVLVITTGYVCLRT